MCPRPQIAPKREQWEVIVSLKVRREWKTPPCIVGGGGKFCHRDQRYSRAAWVAGMSSLCLGRGRGHLLPQLLASSHVRSLDKSHGSSGSRRPGPRLPTGPLDSGLCGMGPWALGCVWDRGTGDPGSCHWLIGIYPDLESEHSGSSAREDSGQNPGVKGLGSSAWKGGGGGVYLLWVRFQHPVPVVKGFGGPTAAVTRTHSLSRWAHIVDLGARIQPVRAWKSEIQWLWVEGVVVEM